jgi:hypothetical protein
MTVETSGSHPADTQLIQELDRRLSERANQQVPVTLRIVFKGGEALWPARTVDLSQRGFRIRTHSILTPGRDLELVSPESQFRHVCCRIVWMRLVGADIPVEAGLEILHGAV